MSIVGIESRRDYMKILKIGEMSRLNNVSIQTLRYYDEIDLFKPAHVDSINNYRYYTLMQCAQLDLIVFLKGLDFSLKEIKLILTNVDAHDIISLTLKKRSESLKKSLQIIKEKNKKIEDFTRGYSLYLKYKDCEGFIIEEKEERYAYIYDIDSNIYDMDLSEYEYYLRKFKLDINKKSENPGFFSSVGSFIRQEDFENRRFESNQLFVFTEENVNKKIKVIPQGKYLVCFCHLFENEYSRLHDLRNYIEKMNYEINGDYICEVVYEIPYIDPNKRNMFIRLQVPIC